MDRAEAIEVLLNLKLFVKMNREEDEAFDMAIAALEGKDINVPSKEEAIPVDWLMQKADWCDKNNGIFTSGVIRSVVDLWREERKADVNEM